MSDDCGGGSNSSSDSSPSSCDTSSGSNDCGGSSNYDSGGSSSYDCGGSSSYDSGAFYASSSDDYRSSDDSWRKSKHSTSSVETAKPRSVSPVALNCNSNPTPKASVPQTNPAPVPAVVQAPAPRFQQVTGTEVAANGVTIIAPAVQKQPDIPGQEGRVSTNLKLEPTELAIEPPEDSLYYDTRSSINSGMKFQVPLSTTDNTNAKSLSIVPFPASPSVGKTPSATSKPRRAHFAEETKLPAKTPAVSAKKARKPLLTRITGVFKKINIGTRKEMIAIKA